MICKTSSKKRSCGRVQTDELGAMLALYQHLHTTDAPAAPDLLEQQWHAMLHDPRLYCLVTVIDDHLVSSCTLVIVPNLTRGARPYG